MPLPVIDGVLGDDVGLAAAQLVTVRWKQRRWERGDDTGGDADGNTQASASLT